MPERAGNLASTANLGISLHYSQDNGETWSLTDAKTAPGGNLPANYNVTLGGSLASNAVVSPFLQLKVEWLAADWAPVLVGLWAEYETLDSPARRRRWTFTIQAQDQVIDRDGAQLTRTGRQQIAELWDHWENGTTLPFHDLDHDDDPTDGADRGHHRAGTSAAPGGAVGPVGGVADPRGGVADGLKCW
jgi:hypothetical protein